MDYYKILGVEKTASNAEIKNAYKRLVKQYHPDLNPNNADKEAKFKQINAAYETLSDPEKRRQYDNPYQNSNTYYTNYGRGNFNDIFRDIFGQNDFDQFFGVRPRFHHNVNYTIEIHLTLEEVFSGVERNVTVKLPSGEIKKVKVNVPKGISNGHKIILRQQGGNTNTQIPPGDLIIICKIKPHAVFNRHNNNLVMELPVNVFGLIAGDEREITTIDGSKVNIKIPAGTNVDKTMRVPNKGLPAFNDTIRGDLLVVIKAYIPKVTNIDDLNTISKLRKKYS